MPDCCRSSIYYCRGFLSGEITSCLSLDLVEDTTVMLLAEEEEERWVLTRYPRHELQGPQDTHGPEGPQVHMGVEVGSLCTWEAGGRYLVMCSRGLSQRFNLPLLLLLSHFIVCMKLIHSSPCA